MPRHEIVEVGYSPMTCRRCKEPGRSVLGAPLAAWLIPVLDQRAVAMGITFIPVCQRHSIERDPAQPRIKLVGGIVPRIECS